MEYQIQENKKRREIIESLAPVIKKAEISNARIETLIALKNLISGKGSFNELINAYKKAKSIEHVADELAVAKAESFFNAAGFLEVAEFLEKQKKSKELAPHTHEQDPIPDALLLLN